MDIMSVIEGHHLLAASKGTEYNIKLVLFMHNCSPQNNVGIWLYWRKRECNFRIIPSLCNELHRQTNLQLEEPSFLEL